MIICRGVAYAGTPSRTTTARDPRTLMILFIIHLPPCPTMPWAPIQFLAPAGAKRLPKYSHLRALNGNSLIQQCLISTSVTELWRISSEERQGQRNQYRRANER